MPHHNLRASIPTNFTRVYNYAHAHKVVQTRGPATMASEDKSRLEKALQTAGLSILADKFFSEKVGCSKFPFYHIVSIITEVILLIGNC